MQGKKQKPIYESFSINLMDNNWNTNADKDGNLLPNKELIPIMLENHPCEYAREIYKLGFKLCKWLNNNKQKYGVSLDGSYIPFDDKPEIVYKKAVNTLKKSAFK